MKLARLTAKINTYLLIYLFFYLFMIVLALTAPHDWFKKFAPFLVIQSEDSFSYTFSRASRQVHLVCFLLCQVRDQWEYPRKMERHFPIKSGQPIEMAVVILNPFTEFPN